MAQKRGSSIQGGRPSKPTKPQSGRDAGWDDLSTTPAGLDMEEEIWEVYEPVGVTAGGMDALRSSLSGRKGNVDDTLTRAQSYINDQLTRAKSYARENQGAVMSGLAGLLMGAGLLTAAIRRDKRGRSKGRSTASAGKSGSAGKGKSTTKSSKKASKKSSKKSTSKSSSKKASKRSSSKKGSKPRRAGASKRELMSPRGNKRFVRRDARGRIKTSVDVGRSLSADSRSKSKKVTKSGQGDRGDRAR